MHSTQSARINGTNRTAGLLKIFLFMQSCHTLPRCSTDVCRLWVRRIRFLRRPGVRPRRAGRASERKKPKKKKKQNHLTKLVSWEFGVNPPVLYSRNDRLRCAPRSNFSLWPRAFAWSGALSFPRFECAYRRHCRCRALIGKSIVFNASLTGPAISSVIVFDGMCTSHSRDMSLARKYFKKTPIHVVENHNEVSVRTASDRHSGRLFTPTHACNVAALVVQRAFHRGAQWNWKCNMQVLFTWIYIEIRGQTRNNSFI